MLSYNTHDEVEGIIQEYSLHILLMLNTWLGAFGFKNIIQFEI